MTTAIGTATTTTTPATVPCKACGRPTTGSVGAAGLRWPSVCQPCKDAADAALLMRVGHISGVVRACQQIPDYKCRMCGCPMIHEDEATSEDGDGRCFVLARAGWFCENDDCDHAEMD